MNFYSCIIKIAKFIQNNWFKICILLLICIFGIKISKEIHSIDLDPQCQCDCECNRW